MPAKKKQVRGKKNVANRKRCRRAFSARKRSFSDAGKTKNVYGIFGGIKFGTRANGSLVQKRAASISYAIPRVGYLQKIALKKRAYEKAIELTIIMDRCALQRSILNTTFLGTKKCHQTHSKWFAQKSQFEVTIVAVSIGTKYQLWNTPELRIVFDEYVMWVKNVLSIYFCSAFCNQWCKHFYLFNQGWMFKE